MDKGIIGLIISLAKSIYTTFLKNNLPSQETPTQGATVTVTTEPDRNYFSHEVWEKARAFLERERKAYFAGWNIWGKDGEPGDHNNVLITQDKKADIKVLRSYRSATGLYSYQGDVIISKKDAAAAKKRGNWQTYCNMFVSVFTQKYAGFRICKFDGHQFGANACFDALAKGIFKTVKYKFVPAKLKEALHYASKGGLSIASWKNPKKGRSGHIAVLTGKGSSLNPGHVGIYQAGKHFGHMSFRKGFGIGKWVKTKYYILKRVI